MSAFAWMPSTRLSCSVLVMVAQHSGVLRFGSVLVKSVRIQLIVKHAHRVGVRAPFCISGAAVMFQLD